MDEPTRNALTSRRIAEFKTHPVRESQESRRQQALLEQKRRRAERIESSRNIDLFANLSLNSPPSVIDNQLDDEESEDDDREYENNATVLDQGISQYVSMLESPPSSTGLPTSFGSTARIHGNRSTVTKKPKSRNPQNANLKKGLSPSLEKRSAILANTIMYAELLEMNSQLLHSETGSEDGLPSDLDKAWTAMAPVPKGKRCLAVSYQGMTSHGDPDCQRSKTLLHSRVKGKPFLTFPSPLPPNSILDCILDSDWRQNGIIHVVDIIRWRGSDFTDGETEFRLWWRDARISELKLLPFHRSPAPRPGLALSTARFAYPITFVPTPYFSSPIPLPVLLNTVIPAARLPRQLVVQVPGPVLDPDATGCMDIDASTMDGHVDDFARSPRESMDHHHSSVSAPVSANYNVTVLSEVVSIASDGILLYVSASSYQPGESPLACWIPVEPLPDTNISECGEDFIGISHLDGFERLVRRRLTIDTPS
ncbi:hypothetical protein FRC03_004101 [Tulasnella sp. 419]|nr:hypothetical protein FRC03_004101 [Tulasnella sp. 419]